QVQERRRYGHARLGTTGRPVLRTLKEIHKGIATMSKTFQHPVVGPRMTPEQLNLMLAHVLRIPKLLAKAKDQLKPEHLNPSTEPHLAVFWRTVLELVGKYGTQVFDDVHQAQALLQTEVQAACQAEGDLLPTEFVPTLFSEEAECRGLIPF